MLSAKVELFVLNVYCIDFRTAAFDFQFGALDNDQNEVSETYKNML